MSRKSKSTFGRGGKDNCMPTADYTDAFENDFTLTPQSCIPDKSCDSGYRSYKVVNNSNSRVVTSACCTCNNKCVGGKCPVCNLRFKDSPEYGSENCFASSSQPSERPSRFNQTGRNVNATYTDCANEKYKSEEGYEQCMRYKKLRTPSSGPAHGPLYSPPSEKSSSGAKMIAMDATVSSSSPTPYSEPPVPPSSGMGSPGKIGVTSFDTLPTQQELKSSPRWVQQWFGWNPFNWFQRSTFGSSTTNMFMVLLLLVILSVAAFVFYKRNKKASQSVAQRIALFGRQIKSIKKM